MSSLTFGNSCSYTYKLYEYAFAKRKKKLYEYAIR